MMFIHHEAKLSCVCHHASRSEAERCIIPSAMINLLYNVQIQPTVK